MRSARKHAAALLATACVALPAHAVQRTFVASYGSDANTATNCTFTNPCRGFTAAHGVTDAGGEIIALDAAGYGTLTVTKSISIIANSGAYAGVSVAAGSGITIATASVKVVLRGLNVNGTGGSDGVLMTNGASLTIENCVFSNFATGRGINVNTPATVRITNTIVRDNSDGIMLEGGAISTLSQVNVFGNANSGIMVAAFTAVTTKLAISDSTLGSNNAALIVSSQDAGATAIASVTRTSISNNGTGVLVLETAGTTKVGMRGSTLTHNAAAVGKVNGTFESLGDNFIRYNTNDSAANITPISPI